jgi:FkbM family methyltransferase
VARPEQPRPRTPLERFAERRVTAASPQTLARYVRLLSPRQRLKRSPGWTFDLPIRRDDPGTFARRLIWQRHRDEQINRPVQVKWCGRLRLNLQVGNDIGWCVFVGGAYEPNELAFLAATLKPGMTVIDVGANEGLHTLVAASRVGPAGRVLAVEPSSREFHRLLANVELNRLDNIEAHRVALCGHVGVGRLAVAEGNHAGQNALGDEIANPEVHATGHEQVELQTLDRIAQDLARLDFVKLDAEGSEAHILQGGVETIRRFQPLMLIEIAPDHLASQGSTVDETHALIAQLGYSTWIFDAEGHPRSDGGEPLDGNIIAARAGWRPPEVP